MTAGQTAEQLDDVEIELRLLLALAVVRDGQFKNDPIALAEHVIAAMLDQSIEQVRTMGAEQFTTTAAEMSALLRVAVGGLDQLPPPPASDRPPLLH